MDTTHLTELQIRPPTLVATLDARPPRLPLFIEVRRVEGSEAEEDELRARACLQRIAAIQCRLRAITS